MDRILSKHILIIDDSLDQQFLLKTLLEAKGYTAECTSNGKDALTILRATENKPDLIILDVNMPIMGGRDFRVQQCLDPSLKAIPVVIMSGDTYVESEDQTIVLSKPVTISKLLDVVKRGCGLH